VSKKVVVGAGLAAVLALAAPLIMRWEGVRYAPYLDAVGVLTVCYGHTGPDIDPNKRYTKAECNAFLEDDMRKANYYVRACIARPMPVGVEAALTSLVFNVGPAPVCIHGREPRKWAKAGEWAKVCASLDLYKYAGGRVYRGLVLRRADERAVCEGRA
jgi:lysozyme